MTDKQVNFEAIGRCTCLQKKVSQLIEDRANLYLELRSSISYTETNVYKTESDYDTISLVEIDKSAELLKKINDINQRIIRAATTYNLWADKAGYKHYTIIGGNNCNISVSVGFAAQVFNVSCGQALIETSAIKEAVLNAVTTKCAKGGFLKAIAETETEDQRRIKALETGLSLLQSSMASLQQTMTDSEQALAVSLERIRSDIQSVRSGWQL
ncbi:hypothetical protein QDQ80_21515 [Providencia rettgeri]|uniref:hypothetical protein n=1 Tax=Providencia rettgeri TaxID=587 RepID=UPI00244A0848|nr:hypothetical protein [Providencia rettgeri]MDH2324868.1 hypothetical protein [Providencia rettgeri]